jgi:hypothetical protein
VRIKVGLGVTAGDSITSVDVTGGAAKLGTSAEQAATSRRKIVETTPNKVLFICRIIL